MIRFIRRWIKRLFNLYDIDDLQAGGNCGCCGKWIANEVFEKVWSWGLCDECIERGRRYVG